MENGNNTKGTVKVSNIILMVTSTKEIGRKIKRMARAYIIILTEISDIDNGDKIKKLGKVSFIQKMKKK